MKLPEALLPRPAFGVAFWMFATFLVSVPLGMSLSPRRGALFTLLAAAPDPEEVDAVLSTLMDREPADRLGEHVEATRKRTAHVKVGMERPSTAELIVTRTESDGFSNSEVRLSLDRTGERARASVRSAGDLSPQPPPEWLDVTGYVYVSTWDWSDVASLVIRYDLYGLRGRHRLCTHGGVALGP